MIYAFLNGVATPGTIPITPSPPPGSSGLVHIVDWVAWLVTLAGIAALIYAGGKFAWERWHGGAVESPKIVLAALAGGILATSAGQIMQEVLAASAH
ncbi:hypothetical protein ABIA39_007551 [Nocardia sp. GAS34]|uniref:hypothetical protein n=1 Tax=unclassified Nocardia TaxID=2637762 RepID=UPI003D227BC9